MCGVQNDTVSYIVCKWKMVAKKKYKNVMAMYECTFIEDYVKNRTVKEHYSEQAWVRMSYSK